MQVISVPFDSFKYELTIYCLTPIHSHVHAFTYKLMNFYIEIQDLCCSLRIFFDSHHLFLSSSSIYCWWSYISCTPPEIFTWTSTLWILNILSLLTWTEFLIVQQLDKVDFNEPISPSLERRVLEAITDICQECIQRYPTTVDEDDKLMRDRGLFGALTRQQRMAIKLRASEKRILERTIQAVQAELEKLPALISMSGTLLQTFISIYSE